MKVSVVKILNFAFLTAATVFSAVSFLVIWVLRGHLKDDWDWL